MMESSFPCCHAVETQARQWMKVTQVAVAEEAQRKRQPFLNKYDFSFPQKVKNVTKGVHLDRFTTRNMCVKPAEKCLGAPK